MYPNKICYHQDNPDVIENIIIQTTMLSFVSKLKKIKKSLLKNSSLVTVTISKSRLLNNLRTYQKTYPHLLIAPVLKSNAYGHGLVLIAKLLESKNVSFFILDSIFEAKILKNQGIKTNLLIIGYTPANIILKNTRAGISFTITNLAQLKELSKNAKRLVRIHIKIDTGMHRQGLMPGEICSAINLVKENINLKLEGICSHFYDADSTNPVHTQKQNKEWIEIVKIFKKSFTKILFIHISATAGARYTKDLPGNMLRLGLGLYGIDMSPFSTLNIKPVLQMESVIGSTRKLVSGDTVGYNGTHLIKKTSLIATVPAGYFEGVDRRLSNRGYFKISDVFCPIVGRVSMNITSIDISNLSNTQYNDVVTIISSNTSDKNSVFNIAEMSGTIPWEILIHIPEHLYRKIIK